MDNILDPTNVTTNNDAHESNNKSDKVADLLNSNECIEPEPNNNNNNTSACLCNSTIDAELINSDSLTLKQDNIDQNIESASYQVKDTTPIDIETSPIEDISNPNDDDSLRMY